MPSGNVVERGIGAPPGSAPLGTAQWMSEAEALEKFGFDDRLFEENADGLWEGRANGQIWVGETFDGGPMPIGYRDDRHVLLVSGTRGGKGTGVIIPNLCLWPGSCIVIDPKGENATVTARRRGTGSEYAYGLNQTVRILDPFGEVQLDPALKARYNPLDAIDPKGDLAVDDAGRIAAAIVVIENQHDPFWEQAARNLLKAVILHVLTARSFEGRRNLVTVWRLLRQGDWLTVERARAAGQDNIPSGLTLLWHGMKRNEAYNGLIAGEAEQMLDMHERTRSGILKVATTATEFIDGPPMQRLLEASDFDLAALKTDPGGLTIYLTLPQRYMTTHYRWLRLMIGLAVGDMERIKGRPATGYPTLFVLDEFAGLKRMEAVENAAAQAAGFGVKFLFVLQNLPQLKEIYDDSWETFLGNSGLRLFFQIDDNFTRTYVAQQIGEREVLRQTHSGSQSRSLSTSTTQGDSSSFTDGTTRSFTDGQTAGYSSSVTDGQNAGYSDSSNSGRSGGSSFNFNGGFTNQSGSNRSRSRSSSTGWSRSKSTSRSGSQSSSRSLGESQSRTASISSSRSQSQSTSSTDGWNEAVHKRLLLNPDEIGRFLARIDDRNHPAYPGILLALIPGAQPLPVHRVNYFQSGWFDGFFDPHSDHPPPPTLKERIQRLAALAKPSEPAPAARPRRRKRIIYAAAAGVAMIAIVAAAQFFFPASTPEHQSAAPETPPASTPEHQSAALETPPANATATPPPIVLGAPLGLSEARAVVIDSYLSGACQAAWNSVTEQGPSPGFPDHPFKIDNPDGSTKWSYTPGGLVVPPEDLDLCGSYTQSAPTLATTSPASAFSIMHNAAFAAARRDVHEYIPVAEGGALRGTRTPTAPRTNLENLARSYAENAGHLPPAARLETAPPTVIQLFRENKLRRGTVERDVGEIMDRFAKATSTLPSR